MPGRTDLATTHPELAAQLVDQSLATELTPGSNRKVEWRCAKGHEWSAVVAPRARRGVGCPHCSGYYAWPGETDLATTHPELAAQLVDQSLAATLTAGSNRKVRWQCERGHRWPAAVANRASGRGCPFCSGRQAIPGETDLATMRPDLAAQLVDHALAVRLTLGSHRRVEWQCERGHRWITSVAHRVSGTGCEQCIGKRATPGETDLATTHPELAAQLVDQSLASTLTAGSNKRVRWRCRGHHEWTATVASRVAGNGCKYCAGRAAWPGESDLATTNPGLAAELVDASLATELRAGSDRKVRWRCRLGHEWDASAANRSKGKGCPECAPTGFSQVGAGWLYLLATPGRAVYKVGITNDLDGRLAAHAAQGFDEVIETLFYEVGADALAAETRILRHAREQGWEPPLTASSMPSGGASETLSADDVGDSFTLSGFLAKHPD